MKYLTTILFAILISNSLDISKLSSKEYTEVKSALKTSVNNMLTKNYKLTFAERDKWIEILRIELKKGCQLKNITEKNLINSLNNCL